MNISVAMACKPLKVEICIHEIRMEGSVSQNFGLDPSFTSMKCRNSLIKNIIKSYPFFDI